MQRQISRWLIEHDPDLTRLCIAQLPIGTECICNQCRNFDAAVGRTFPAEFVEMANTLGIEVTKPVELCHYNREPTGLYLTGGWFHFVGSILNGEDVMNWSGNSGTYRFEELVPGCEFGFGARLSLVREVFRPFSLIQLEFMTRVPWVLDEPAPA